LLVFFKGFSVLIGILDGIIVFKKWVEAGDSIVFFDDDDDEEVGTGLEWAEALRLPVVVVVVVSGVVGVVLAPGPVAFFFGDDLFRFRWWVELLLLLLLLLLVVVVVVAAAAAFLFFLPVRFSSLSCSSWFREKSETTKIEKQLNRQKA
jgi:hypothetical protein